jgi:hypothetical protein
LRREWMVQIQRPAANRGRSRQAAVLADIGEGLALRQEITNLVGDLLRIDRLSAEASGRLLWRLCASVVSPWFRFRQINSLGFISGPSVGQHFPLQLLDPATAIVISQVQTLLLRVICVSGRRSDAGARAMVPAKPRQS